MDMNHQFLHRKQMGRCGRALLAQDEATGLGGGRLHFARTGGKQPIGEAAIFGQRRGTDPANAAIKDVMTIRTEYPYQTLQDPHAGRDCR